MLPLRIALDGPAASGKTTIGRRLAENLGYLYFDTGVMYRAVTLAVLRAGISPANEDAVSDLAEHLDLDVQPPTKADGRACTVLLFGTDVTWSIRGPDVDANVSRVAAYRRVRKAMTEQQRRIGERGRVVMVGRDIGTVVMPDAELKIFVDASLETRAERRFLEQKIRGGNLTLEAVRESLAQRDQQDSCRDVAPLRAAEDAIVLDTTALSPEEVLAAVERLVFGPK
jgi:CMP/dCMP kinase